MLITITFLPNLVGKYNQLFPICANFSVFYLCQNLRFLLTANGSQCIKICGIGNLLFYNRLIIKPL